MNIIQAIRDPNLFRPVLGDLSTWSAWITVLKAAFGLPMDNDELELFTQLTGRKHAPTERAEETWLAVGRRSGKSRVTAIVAAYLAVFFDYSKYLAPGELGVLMVISQNRKQARIIFGYLQAIFTDIPMLKKLVAHMSKESIELTNGIIIEIHVSNFRSVRGYTCIGAVLDEIAYWFTEDSANPDHEIVTALKPAMSTIPGAMMVGLSSPYRRAGVLYEAHREHFGKDHSDTLVIQSDTLTMNPTINRKTIGDAYRKDPEAAKAEWGGLFRSDIAAFVDATALDAVVPMDVTRRHYIEGTTYRAFTDPSGGSSDSFTLAIAHEEDNIPTLDMIVEYKPPFSPTAVVKDFAALLKQYRITSVTGDRYSGDIIREMFRNNGIAYNVAELNRSQLYLELLPLINSGNCSLLDNKTLVSQLCALERRTTSVGKDMIDHCRGSHDDVANAVAGVMALLTKKPAILYEVDLTEGTILDAAEIQWRHLTMQQAH